MLKAARSVRPRNILTSNDLQDGLFCPAKQAVLRCEKGRFALRKGPFRNLFWPEC